MNQLVRVEIDAKPEESISPLTSHRTSHVAPKQTWWYLAAAATHGGAVVAAAAARAAAADHRDEV